MGAQNLWLADKYPGKIDLTNFTQDFFSSSRRINRRIAGYATYLCNAEDEKKDK
jgi:ribosomal protein S17E